MFISSGSGTGNLKLVNTPEVAFPKDFEVYDPKIDNKFTLTREGLSGNKVIEYLAIPRHAGNFTIPPVEFSYFDLKSNSYKTIKTEAYSLEVEKGAGNADQIIADFTNKEDLKVLGQDIRYIKMGETSLTRKGDFFFGSTNTFNVISSFFFFLLCNSLPNNLICISLHLFPLLGCKLLFLLFYSYCFLSQNRKIRQAE